MQLIDCIQLVLGDIRLTPFYDIDECLVKIKSYIDEINNGKDTIVYTCNDMHVHVYHSTPACFQCTKHMCSCALYFQLQCFTHK